MLYVRLHNCYYIVGEVTDNSSDLDDPDKPPRSRHHLLRCRLTPWEAASEEDADKPASQKRNMKKAPITKLIVGQKCDFFFFKSIPFILTIERVSPMLKYFLEGEKNENNCKEILIPSMMKNKTETVNFSSRL